MIYAYVVISDTMSSSESGQADAVDPIVSDPELMTTDTESDDDFQPFALLGFGDMLMVYLARIHFLFLFPTRTLSSSDIPMMSRPES